MTPVLPEERTEKFNEFMEKVMHSLHAIECAINSIRIPAQTAPSGPLSISGGVSTPVTVTNTPAAPRGRPKKETQMRPVEEAPAVERFANWPNPTNMKETARLGVNGQKLNEVMGSLPKEELRAFTMLRHTGKYDEARQMLWRAGFEMYLEESPRRCDPTKTLKFDEDFRYEKIK